MSIEAIQLHYSRVGKKSDLSLVFLHGFCEDSTMWDEVLKSGFSEYQVIIIDLPGFGKSAVQEIDSLKAMANAVINLLDELGVAQFYLFGHSMGGYVALTIAAHFESRLLGLGLINSHPYADDGDSKLARQKSIDFVLTHGSSLYVKQLIPKLFPDHFANSNRFLIEQLTFRANNYPDAGIANAQRAMMNRPDQSQVLTKLTIPVLCIIGGQDNLIPNQLLIEQAQYPGLTHLEVIPKMGHMGPFEKPTLVRKAIKDYLTTVYLLNN